MNSRLFCYLMVDSISVFWYNSYIITLIRKEHFMGTEIINIPNWDNENKYNYEDTFLDYGALDDLNKQLASLGHTLKYINRKLAEYEKQKAKCEVAYKREYRESFLAAQVTLESHRKIHAEIACEELEMKNIYLDQIIKELQRLSFSVRTELDILQTIGHNIRRELNL